jgi:D-glycero-D-manno-heptose 1,7-bisphosphate phosphatase
MTRLILLDRDGVINFDSPDYVKSPDEWRPIPGSLKAIAALKAAGFAVGVCTNQSGIGRGHLTESSLAAIHAKMAALLAVQGATFDGLRYCPHHPECGCECRKPSPFMLLSLMTSLGCTPRETCFVGNARTDLEAARNAKCEGVLLTSGDNQVTPADAALLGVTRIYATLADFARSEVARRS